MFRGYTRCMIINQLNTRMILASAPDHIGVPQSARIQSKASNLISDNLTSESDSDTPKQILSNLSMFLTAPVCPTSSPGQIPLLVALRVVLRRGKLISTEQDGIALKASIHDSE